MAEEKKLKRQEHEQREGWGMKPWEQHSAAISIPRFDYNAPSSLLHHSHCGFLITCPIKREKSATKEAISILQQFIGSYNGGCSKASESSDANVDAKRRKTCTGEIDREFPNSAESKSSATKFLADSRSPSAKADTNVERSPTLSLVKLTGSGLLLFTFSRNESPNVVDIVSRIMCSLESGSSNSPLWCHRIIPIQATSCLNEKDLRAIVSKLVLQFINDNQNKLSRPIKFAVGYNRRGIEETKLKISRNTWKGHENLALLGRKECFSLVAAAVNDVVSDSVVDLKSPELSVLVELLPISGLPNGSSVVAVSILPSNLVSTKPRLCIKALLADSNGRNDQKNQ